jgi:integrase
LRAHRHAGDTEKTLRDYTHYLREVLAELNWTLTPDGIREYLSELAEDGEEHVLHHLTTALKSLLKAVLEPRGPYLFGLLYHTFKTYRARSNNRVRLPTIDQLRQIWQNLPTIESRLYFALLAETGLRPGEPFTLTIDDLDLGHVILHIGKVTETKRALIAFLRPEFLERVRNNYSPHRESWVERMAKAWEASNLFGQDIIENAKLS